MRLAALLLLVMLAPAYADTPATPPTKQAKAEAKQHGDAGTKYFNVQQFDKAAEEYQQAYLLDPQPGYLYASAQAQRMNGDCAKALQSYQAYLRTNPDEAQRQKAQANIDRCEQDLKDKEAAVEPTSVAPPPDVPNVPPPPPPVVPPPPPPPPGKSYLLGHLLVGTGAVALGGGIFLFASGRSAVQDHNDAPTYDAFLAGQDDADTAKLKQTIGVSAIVSGTALVAGGILYYVMKAKSPDETSVTAAVAPGTALLAVKGAF